MHMQLINPMLKKTKKISNSNTTRYWVVFVHYTLTTVQLVRHLYCECYLFTHNCSSVQRWDVQIAFWHCNFSEYWTADMIVSAQLGKIAGLGMLQNNLPSLHTCGGPLFEDLFWLIASVVLWLWLLLNSYGIFGVWLSLDFVFFCIFVGCMICLYACMFRFTSDSRVIPLHVSVQVQLT